MISAQIQSDKVPSDVKRALDDGGNMLTSANNILVLGSDKRPGESGPSRADTIMLMRYGGGKAARLSIPRDTLVNIPGHGPDKINAAYAFGGPGADDPHGQGVPRHRGQPPRRGRLRGLPRSSSTRSAA